MIFVATGTTGFDALAERMDQIAPTLDEPVIIQLGDGRYVPRQAEYFRFAPSLKPYYGEASLVIAHGGMGICLEVLDCGKPLIALDNPDRFDQHQQDVLRVLAAQNYLVWCQDLNELPEALERARHREFKRYVPPQCEVHIVIAGFLQDQESACGPRSRKCDDR
jgi:beta-1,4-N-acetylglucosaminyltransferase